MPVDELAQLITDKARIDLALEQATARVKELTTLQARLVSSIATEVEQRTRDAHGTAVTDAMIADIIRRRMGRG